MINLASIELAPEVPHRSVSQLSTYTQCSEQFRLQRIARAPERPAAWLCHGSAFHLAIEEWECSGRQMPLEAAQDLYREDYDRRIAEALEKEPDYTRWMTGGNAKGETDIEKRRVTGADQVAMYVSYAEAHADLWRILPAGPRGYACELEFNIEFAGVKVLGFIDQLREYRDGRVVPIDLKSGSREPASSFQLGVYAHAIEQNLGTRPVSGAFFMPRLRRDGSLKGDIWHGLEVWSTEMLDRMFSDFDKAERAGIYLPNPGDSCRTCSVADYCSVKGIPELSAQYAEVRRRQPAAVSPAA